MEGETYISTLDATIKSDELELMSLSFCFLKLDHYVD